MRMTVVSSSHTGHRVSASFIFDVAFCNDIASDFKISRAFCQRSIYCHRGRSVYQDRTGNALYPYPVAREIDFSSKIIKNTNLSIFQISRAIAAIRNNDGKSLITIPA